MFGVREKMDRGCERVNLMLSGHYAGPTITTSTESQLLDRVGELRVRKASLTTSDEAFKIGEVVRVTHISSPTIVIIFYQQC